MPVGDRSTDRSIDLTDDARRRPRPRETRGDDDRSRRRRRRDDGDRRRLRPDAAKFKIQNLAAPRGQILNFELLRKSYDGDATTAKATVDGANGPKPAPPTLSPKMFISPVLLMGGKRLGIDYKDPAHVVKIRMCFVVAMTTLALAFAFLWVRLVGKKKKL